jgi:hypothetical protein
MKQSYMKRKKMPAMILLTDAEVFLIRNAMNSLIKLYHFIDSKTNKLVQYMVIEVLLILVLLWIYKH